MNIIKWGQKWWEPSTEHLGNSTVLVGAASGKLENYPVGKQENGKKDNTPEGCKHSHGNIETPYTRPRCEKRRVD